MPRRRRDSTATGRRDNPPDLVRQYAPTEVAFKAHHSAEDLATAGFGAGIVCACSKCKPSIWCRDCMAEKLPVPRLAIGDPRNPWRAYCSVHAIRRKDALDFKWRERFYAEASQQLRIKAKTQEAPGGFQNVKQIVASGGKC